MRHIFKFLILAPFLGFLVCGCQHLSPVSTAGNRPHGLPQPNAPRTQTYLKNALDGKCASIPASYLTPTPSDSTSGLWKDYIAGLCYFNKKQFGAGVERFRRPITSTRKAPKASQISIRISALCLKKLGWNARRKKSYELAMGFHAARVALLQTHGSFEELHDAYISLDVDSYHLKDKLLSKYYLESSIIAAKQIRSPHERLKALGISHNNLAYTLEAMNLFESALAHIEKSTEYWRSYEIKTNKEKSDRLIWAHYAQGEILEGYANHPKTDKQLGTRLLERAQHQLTLALELSKSRNLTEKTRKPIVDKLSEVEASLSHDQS